jgi:hypothetical protein
LRNLLLERFLTFYFTARKLGQEGWITYETIQALD